MSSSNNTSTNNFLFSKELSLCFLSKSDILKQLNSLFGCVYLENNGQPVIGFLPEKYCIQIQDVHHVFDRDKDLKYKKNIDISSLSDFIMFQSMSNQDEFGYFNGGYIGFIDYNFATQAQVKTQFRQQPNAYLGCYKSFIRNENNHWIFHSLESNAQEIFDLLEEIINQPDQSNFKLTAPCHAQWKKSEYIQSFEKIQEYIVAGDCYQINLTQAFTAKATGNLIETAEDFWSLTNAPYAGYLKLDEFELLSCSPELFIDFKNEREIVTRPIKGTMPRYADPLRDQQSKNTLKHSEKDQAENLMIVDLLRNDLSVYAEKGSVKTPQLFEIESFNQVHHMVSEVRATLKADVHPFDMLLSALPGGSITGAPKIRAMQIIEELESSPRGAYCGSMGYFNFDGTGSWNILIRSIQKYQDDVSIWAGGGITIASNADAEYQECFDKVSAMLDLLNTWYQPE
ncbi:anthranilate synthase component I family protein [Acinetobacter shaoyimingii]|uniref:Anthranilate synthase component I family protein n=1 Tax=Acinetobacter shaoyimingii TaxID=2715164 RepID=A0A6G8RT65_9GAMM|nr:anthranilate synthase component I family protein [Acinetobacter shaoyimingii]